MTPAKRFLLVKGRQSNKWSFPKGHRNRGELAIDCALRELQEETGIALTAPSTYPKSFIFSRNNDGSGPEYFLIEVEEELNTHINDMREISEVGWYSVEEMYQLSGNIDITRFLKHVRHSPF